MRTLNKIAPPMATPENSFICQQQHRVSSHEEETAQVDPLHFTNSVGLLPYWLKYWGSLTF